MPTLEFAVEPVDDPTCSGASSGMACKVCASAAESPASAAPKANAARSRLPQDSFRIRRAMIFACCSIAVAQSTRAGSIEIRFFHDQAIAGDERKRQEQFAAV
jgi:hypothetical protein